MTTDDSPTRARQRSDVAQQFRDWLTNRYRTDSFEAIGIQVAPVVETPALSSSRSNESGEKEFDVYLSYNSTDKETIQPLVMELHKQGLTVYSDTEHLSLGDDLSSAIRWAIRSVRCIVLCVSKRGLGGWQRAEFDDYIRQLPDLERSDFNEHAIPVLLPGAPDPHDQQASWNSALWLDFRSGLGDSELDQLVSSIKAKINTDR